MGVVRQQGDIEHGGVGPDEKIRQDAPARPSATPVAKGILKGIVATHQGRHLLNTKLLWIFAPCLRHDWRHIHARICAGEVVGILR